MYVSKFTLDDANDIILNGLQATDVIESNHEINDTASGMSLLDKARAGRRAALIILTETVLDKRVKNVVQFSEENNTDFEDVDTIVEQLAKRENIFAAA